MWCQHVRRMSTGVVTASAWSGRGCVMDMTTVQRVKMNSTAVRVHSYVKPLCLNHVT